MKLNLWITALKVCMRSALTLPALVVVRDTPAIVLHAVEFACEHAVYWKSKDTRLVMTERGHTQKRCKADRCNPEESFQTIFLYYHMKHFQ